MSITNRERIAKTDICDFLTELSYNLLPAACIMDSVKGEYVCPAEYCFNKEICHDCISRWLNEKITHYSEGGEKYEKV